MVGLSIKKQVIAVDLGGTYLRTALVKGNKILKYDKKRTPKQKNMLLVRLFDSISKLMNKNVKAIGIASPGPLENGVIKNPPNIPLQNFDLKGRVKKIFRRRVEVANDAGCVALAEAKLGCKKKNFIVLTLGTGVGGGIILNGEQYSGGSYGGELGYMILDNKKTLEDLWKDHRKLSRKYFGKTLIMKELLKKKDRKARKIVENTAMYLAQGISNLNHIFDPEVVVLMGGIRETGNKFLDLVKKYVKEYNLLPKTTPIEWSKIDHPGILGASLLVR
jgi:glucokinase